MKALLTAFGCVYRKVPNELELKGGLVWNNDPDELIKHMTSAWPTASSPRARGCFYCPTNHLHQCAEKGACWVGPSNADFCKQDCSNNSQHSSNGYHYERVKKQVKISHEGTKLAFQKGNRLFSTNKLKVQKDQMKT